MLISMSLLLKTVIIYFIILLVMKFMGKREIGQLSLFDFIVLLLIADVSVIAIDVNKTSTDFLYSLIPIFVLSLIQKILAIILLKLPFLRNFFDGKESIIIENGILDVNELKKQRYNIDDLIPIIRLKNIRSMSEIKYLIIEPNGEISIFTNEEKIKDYISLNHANPLTTLKNSQMGSNYYSTSIFPLITSGIINDENLKRLKLKKEWLINEIKRSGYTSEKDIYYACFENNKLFILKTKQEDKKLKKKRVKL